MAVTSKLFTPGNIPFTSALFQGTDTGLLSNMIRLSHVCTHRPLLSTTHISPSYSRALSYLGTVERAGTCSLRLTGCSFHRRNRILHGSVKYIHGKVDNTAVHNGKSPENKDARKKVPADGLSLNHFIAQTHKPSPADDSSDLSDDNPYVSKESYNGNGRRVYFETYGCQMNVNDMEIVWSILDKNGFLRTQNIKEADVVLLMTCSIREGAETKIWSRVDTLQSLKKQRNKRQPPVKIGILGCMAERLKEDILERKRSVDLVCGPDAYKDLPRLLSVTQSGQNAVNVLLSLDETYADVMPIRLNSESPSAFVSIMRGCDNMCSYCIVPFTRGRERSRPITSILDECLMLRDQFLSETLNSSQAVEKPVEDKQVGNKTEQIYLEGPCVSDETVNLTGSWRKDLKGSQLKPVDGDFACDANLQSDLVWFRFTGEAGQQLSNQCPDSYSCGAHGGFWSDAQMPTKVGELRQVPIYGSWNGNCQWYSWPSPTSLTVQRCSDRPGDFVYKVHGTGSCFWTFCGMDVKE